jgi:hypothetical protein
VKDWGSFLRYGGMTQLPWAAGGLGKFGGYRKARELYELTVRDLAGLSAGLPCGHLVAQQIASADSIAANIEEGYGRGSLREFVQFLVIARGRPRKPPAVTNGYIPGCRWR